MATELPVALGVCDAQVGGTFLITVQVRVFELVPFDSVATRVLAPVFNCDESRFSKLVVTPRLEPLSDHATVQLPSDDETPNEVDVAPTDETRTVAVDGELEAMAQTFCTVTVQEQVVVS
jgi:hypothetical protein